MLEVLVIMWSNANEYDSDYRNPRTAISWATFYGCEKAVRLAPKGSSSKNNGKTLLLAGERMGLLKRLLRSAAENQASLNAG